MEEKKIKRLKNISPRKIKQNPENPRLIFRQKEMEDLMVSISQRGIQVPVAVYEHDGLYFLIDGERRWRCALKLNLDKIPALVQSKPTELENLLLMSNIHALREQWDYFTIAKNLSRIKRLYERDKGYSPNEVELSQKTGLTRGQIRRCQLLMELPDKYQKMLLNELELPKSHQKLSEDFFIEMERSLKTVLKRLPGFGEELNRIRDSLISKFRKGKIESVTDFRKLSKIATAIENIGIRKQKAEKALGKLFDPSNDIGIRAVYERTVEFGYDEKKAINLVDNLNEYFESLFADELVDQLDAVFIERLFRLYKYLKKLLEDKK